MKTDPKDQFVSPHLRLSFPCCSPAAVRAQTQKRPEPKVPLYLGTAWYPEQWPESRWDADLTLMEKAHIRFVRITEFAWSTMEPSEGHYDLDWVERAVRHGREASYCRSYWARQAPPRLRG